MVLRILFAMLLLTILMLAGSAEEAQVESEITTTSEASQQLDKVDLSNSVIERSSHAHVYTDSSFKGFWAKKFAWRPRWVKTWQEKKVYVAVWKRMWGPVEVKEWVPVPKPPPGWIKHDVGSYIIKKFPQH